MDFARVFQCMVCTTKHLISRREKKKMMMNYIDNNIDIILSISKLTCMSEASPVQHFLTTRLQYRTLKLLCAICSILVKLFTKHSLYTGYKVRWTGGPLNCYQRSDLLKELCDKIVKHSSILGEHFLKIDMDENCWRSDFDETVYLLHRINRSLWRYALGYHAKNCKDCLI